jgi:hypothetical protein
MVTMTALRESVPLAVSDGAAPATAGAHVTTDAAKSAS